MGIIDFLMKVGVVDDCWSLFPPFFFGFCVGNLFLQGYFYVLRFTRSLYPPFLFFYDADTLDD